MGVDPTLKAAILQTLRNKSGSPAGIALRLDTTLPNVIDALRTMEKCGQVRFVNGSAVLEGVGRTYYVTGYGERCLVTYLDSGRDL